MGPPGIRRSAVRRTEVAHSGNGYVVSRQKGALSLLQPHREGSEVIPLAPFIFFGTDNKWTGYVSTMKDCWKHLGS